MRALLKPGLGIDGLTVLAELEVQPRPRERPRLPDGSDHLTFAHDVARGDLEFVQEARDTHTGATVIDDRHLTVAAEPVREDHPAGGDRAHRRAALGGDLDAGAARHRVELGIDLTSEALAHLARDRARNLAAAQGIRTAAAGGD